MKRVVGSRGISKAVAAATLALVSVLASHATQGMEGQVKEVGGYKLELSFMNSPLVVGKNQIMLRLADASMNPVEGAMVDTSISMDQSMKMANSAMDNQKPMLISLMRNPDQSKKGEYMADISFPYDGKWIVETKVQVGSETIPATFEVVVDRAGPNLFIVGGLIGIIVIIIVVAGFNKARASRKPSPAARG